MKSDTSPMAVLTPVPTPAVAAEKCCSNPSPASKGVCLFGMGRCRINKKFGAIIISIVDVRKRSVMIVDVSVQEVMFIENRNPKTALFVRENSMSSQAFRPRSTSLKKYKLVELCRTNYYVCAPSWREIVRPSLLVEFKPGVLTQSEPEEAEVDDEADVEILPEGTVKIGVDVTTSIDIPNDLLMSDTIKRLEQSEESVQDQHARNMIGDAKRSSLLERIAALEGTNMRLQDALGVERVKVDSLQRRLGYVEDELRQIWEIRSYKSQRLWRMETFLMRTQSYRP
ncbi:hypothetical protein Tco_0410615 [Tanacetum coccineum]